MKVRTWLAAALVIVALCLSGCGSEKSKKQPTPSVPPVLAVEGPPCQLSEHVPLHYNRIMCVEVVYDEVQMPEAAPALMGLAFGPDGTLYMAGTARGDIWAMRDDDGDQVLDAPFQVASGLTLPTALAVYGGSLVVASVGGLVRLDPSGGDRFDQQTILVDDLAAPTGPWPGSVAVGPDERLYVSLGANCDDCTSGDVQSGRLVSYALDGSGERIEVTGLHSPADFAWHPETGDLWIVDSGRVVPGSTGEGPPDELNRVEPGADYGFPYCYGDRVPDPVLDAPQAETCADSVPPALTFPYQSRPGGIVFYPFDDPEGWNYWHNDLIVVLSGSWDLPEPAGYALEAVNFGDDARPDGAITRLAPAASPFAAYYSNTLAQFSLLGRGFFPYHPVDVVVSAEGWLYVSLQEGRILRFRPRPAERTSLDPTPTLEP